MAAYSDRNAAVENSLYVRIDNPRLPFFYHRCNDNLCLPSTGSVCKKEEKELNYILTKVDANFDSNFNVRCLIVSLGSSELKIFLT